MPRVDYSSLGALAAGYTEADLATIEQGANGAADLVGPPRVLFDESAALTDYEARWRTSPLLVGPKLGGR